MERLNKVLAAAGVGSRRKCDELIAAGHVRPIVGARFPLESATEALELIDGRGALGKVVLEP